MSKQRPTRTTRTVTRRYGNTIRTTSTTSYGKGGGGAQSVTLTLRVVKGRPCGRHNTFDRGEEWTDLSAPRVLYVGGEVVTRVRDLVTQPHRRPVA